MKRFSYIFKLKILYKNIPILEAILILPLINKHSRPTGRGNYQ